MTPLRRLCDFFTNKSRDNVVGEDANATAGTRIVVETIESRIIDAGGAGYSIRGKFVKSSGQKIFEVGESVNVLFKRDEPVVILGHSWRKAQFEEPPVRAVAFGTLEIVSPADITLPSIPDPEGGDPIPQSTQRFVIFTGKGQFALDPKFPGLNPPPELDEMGEQIDPEAPPADVLEPLDAVWGENGNHILFRFSILDDPTFPTSDREFLQVFKINRNVDSTKVPLKKDPADNTKILKVGNIPVVDGELVGNRIPEFNRDMPLRRGDGVGGLENQTYTVRENVIVKTFHDVEFNGEAAEDDVLETIFKENQTSETFPIEEEREMLLGNAVRVPERFDSFGYLAGLVANFLDGDNQIIQIVNINWDIGELFSNADENRIRVKMPTVSTSDSIMPTVSELLKAAGFLQPTMAFPLGDPDDLPDLRQGGTIVALGSIVERGPHADAFGFDRDGIFFENFANLQIIPAVNWISTGVFASYFDVYALKRDTTQAAVAFRPGGSGDEWDPAEDKSVIIAASFEQDITLEYDRTVTLPMTARLFRVPEGDEPHTDRLSIQRPVFSVSSFAGTPSFVDDGTGQPNLLNLGRVTGGVAGPAYFTDEFGGGLLGAPITVGADGILDQIGLQDPGPPTRIFPQAFAQYFPTINNVKFRGRFKFGDPPLRPELPDVVKETSVTRKAFGGLSTAFAPFNQPGTITTPQSSVDIVTSELSFIEEGEPAFTSTSLTGLSRIGPFKPIINKGALVMIGVSSFGEDPRGPFGNLPRKVRILRWDYANEDDEFFINSPTQPFKERGPAPIFFNIASRLFAHDASIYLRWNRDAPDFAEHIFIPPRPGEPESAGDRVFRGGKEPSTVAVNFQFIRPGRGKTGQVQQSYSNEQGTGPEAERAKVRDRIYRITVDSEGLAEIVQTTAPPNTDVRQLNPEVDSFTRFDEPSYHYAGIK